jgi:hypothetical protein
MRPYLEKTLHTHKKGWCSGSRCRPRVQAPVLEKAKKKKKKKKKKGKKKKGG